MAKRKRRDRWPELCDSVSISDGLQVRDCGSWSELKLHFWNRYIEITTNAMVGHPNWPAGLVYVDLFAGPGVCKVRESGRCLPGSPIIAAMAPKGFRKILLCEANPLLAGACNTRLAALVPRHAFTVFQGDCNAKVPEILREIPVGALTLAFLEPEGLDISFETVRKLTNMRQVDLLMLIADRMDFNRNVELYLQQEASKVDAFLGEGSDWRRQWNSLGNTEGSNACKFLMGAYEEQLRNRLGYFRFGWKTIHSAQGPIYRLLFASKHERGLEFWEKVTKKDVRGQSDLF